MYIMIYQMKNNLCNWSKTPDEFEMILSERAEKIGHIWPMCVFVRTGYHSASLQEYLYTVLYIYK